MSVFDKADDVEPITIVIAGQIPRAPDFGTKAYLAFYAEYYQRAGARLAALLLTHLPGGTLDQLLVELLKNKASLLSVRFTPTENEK